MVANYENLIEHAYAEADRALVFKDLDPVDRGQYYLCTCPQCGSRRAFAYKHGLTIRCNRQNKCGYEATLLQYLAGAKSPRGEVFREAVEQLAAIANIDISRNYTPAGEPRKAKMKQFSEVEFKPRPELEKFVKQFQENLHKPGNPALVYLKQRGIPIRIADKFEAGFAPYGAWSHVNEKGKPVRQWRPGRLVFPVRNDIGEIINLYGRAIGKCTKHMKHDFLPGPKGIFNQKVLTRRTVAVCEGIFDALSMIASGWNNVVAIFGVYGFRWNLVKSSNVIFCFDMDKAGAKWEKQAQKGLEDGKGIFCLEKRVYEGHNDLNDLWQTKRHIILKRANVKKPGLEGKFRFQRLRKT